MKVKCVKNKTNLQQQILKESKYSNTFLGPSRNKLIMSTYLYVHRIAEDFEAYSRNYWRHANPEIHYSVVRLTKNQFPVMNQRFGFCKVSTLDMVGQFSFLYMYMYYYSTINKGKPEKSIARVLKDKVIQIMKHYLWWTLE